MEAYERKPACQYRRMKPANTTPAVGRARPRSYQPSPAARNGSLAQSLFDVEAFRRFDVFQVNAADGELEKLAELNHLFGSSDSTSRSNTSMSAKRLKRTALPSITGFPANGPMFPRPRTAVPLDTTAIKLPLLVYRNALLGSSLMSRHGTATPGV
jgi:hypothetical protein